MRRRVGGGSGPGADAGPPAVESTGLPLPVLAADLTFAVLRRGRVYADLVNWEGPGDPVVGGHVLLAGGGRRRPEAVITEIRDDGALVLQLIDTGWLVP